MIFRWISIDGMMHGSKILEKRTHKPIFWKKFALFNPFEFQKPQSESRYKEHNSMIRGIAVFEWTRSIKNTINIKSHRYDFI